MSFIGSAKARDGFGCDNKIKFDKKAWDSIGTSEK